MVEHMVVADNGKTSIVRVPPYIAYRTLKTFLEDLRTHGIPDKIDRSVWGAGVSGSVGVQLMSALRFLRLVNADDKPEPELGTLVNSIQTDAWGATLKGVIEQAYEPIVGLNLAGMTYQHLFDEFRRQYKAQDTVLGKSVRFFIQAAEEAGLGLGGRITKGVRKGRPRSGARPGSQRRSGNNTTPQVEMPPPLSPGNPMQMLIDILDPDSMEKDEEQAVWTLIRYLKKKAQMSV